MSREGPGLLLRDLGKADDPQIAAVIDQITALQADVLVLMDVDHDLDLRALTALRDRLAQAGLDYPAIFGAAPNRGVPTGLDLDRDGRLAEPEDAQGFAGFRGQGGLAILSRRPILRDQVREFSSFLWADLPGALMPAELGPEAQGILRLSTTAHWEVPVDIGQGRILRLLVWHGSTPAFDGAEDRNGRRNHDETAFWSRLLDGDLPFPAPPPPFVILGQANADPDRGDGRREAIRALLADPRLQDPLARHVPSETVDYGRDIGRLRVTYVLPSADLTAAAAGHGAARAEASRHWPVWVDLRF